MSDELTPNAAALREMRRHNRDYRETATEVMPPTVEPGICPTCGVQRRTAETLRAHWQIAHGDIA